MLHTCIMAVRYDFSSRAATIVATKVGLHHLLRLQPQSCILSAVLKVQFLQPCKCGIKWCVTYWADSLRELYT